MEQSDMKNDWETDDDFGDDFNEDTDYDFGEESGEDFGGNLEDEVDPGEEAHDKIEERFEEKLAGSERLPALVGWSILIWSFVVFMLGNNLSIHDQAMVYLRYAYNFANGYGLVFNPGEYHESTTNFLWILLLTPAFWFGFDPTTYLRFVGVAIGAAVLWQAYRLTEKLEGRVPALLVVVLLGLHGSFCFALGSGFAPHLVALLALMAMYRCLDLEKSPTLANGAVVALLMSLLLLTRLDAFLIFGVIWLLAMFTVKREENQRLAIIVGATPLVVFGLYLLWKKLYYGDILPISYYARLYTNQLPERGVNYLWTYFSEYWFVFPVLFVALGIQQRFARYATLSTEAMARVACLAVVLVWCVYMVAMGGGHVDFRFMATVAPFLLIFIIIALRFDRIMAFVGAVVLLLGAANYNMHFKGINEGNLAVERLSFAADERPMKELGLVLSGIFSEFGEYHPSVKIAASTRGYLPFYSKLLAVDMHGGTNPQTFLEDNHVKMDNPNPGYGKVAIPGFLSSQSVNLVFGHPGNNMVSRTESNEEVFQQDRVNGYIGSLTLLSGAYGYPSNMQMVRLPIDGENDIIALYLVRNAELDEFFARKGYHVHNVF